MADRSRSFGLVALSALVAACSGAPSGAGQEDVPEASAQSIAADEVQLHETWFVELSLPPTARGGEPAALRAEKERFRRHLAAAGVSTVERYAFDRLWNGVSLHVTPADLPRVLALPGVKAVHPVHTIQLDRAPSDGAQRVPAATTSPGWGGMADGTSQPDLATAVTMTGADIAHSSLNLYGDGIKVGVIDTGIDYNHPDLGGCFGPGCRVAFGYDLVGDAYDAAASSGTTPVPDNNPDDCAGHGTHVSGIIGANGGVVGVAPHVTFGAYRVFGCAGSTSTDIMIKAMEMAEADGVRVVNMSIGSSFSWPESPEAQAANQLVANGIVVVASIGNSSTTAGGGPVWTAGAPGVGEQVIGVASIDNLKVSQIAFTITPDGSHVGWNTAAGSPVAPGSGSAPIVHVSAVSTTATANDGCTGAPSAPAAGSLTGKIALIRRGTCAFYQKAYNAQQAGAAAVVLYNNVAGALNPSVAGTPAVTIPVVGISGTDGAVVDAQLQLGAVTLTWGSTTVATVNPTAGLISSFSSTGLTQELVLKPDLAAPGGSIFSTWPLELGGYASLSGTSMASPHVAGAAALLLQARPNLTSGQVRDVLQNYAVPVVWGTAQGGDGATLDLANRQGAGMIHIDVAAQARVTASPGKLSLGESAAGPSTQVITFVNEGASSVVYTPTHTPAASQSGTAYAPTISATAGPAAVSFSAPSVTVPAGGSATVSATITASAALADGSIYGGYLVFTPSGGGAALSVPYAGFKGDYQAIQILAPTASGYPWLAKKPAASYVNQPSGATYTLQSGDVPYIVAHYEHAARHVKIEVFDAVKGKPYGTFVDEDFDIPSSTATGTFGYVFGGTTLFNKNVTVVPNGTYVFKLSALKALGDSANPADWETWTSPVVTLDHP